MDSSQPENKEWPYAVAHRVLVPDANGQPKETDMLEYCIDINHAHAVAHQGLAMGWQGIAIIDLKSKVG